MPSSEPLNIKQINEEVHWLRSEWVAGVAPTQWGMSWGMVVTLHRAQFETTIGGRRHMITAGQSTSNGIGLQYLHVNEAMHI